MGGPVKFDSDIGDLVAAQALTKELSPIIEGLLAEGKKGKDIDPGQVIALAMELRRLVHDEWGGCRLPQLRENAKAARS